MSAQLRRASTRTGKTPIRNSPLFIPPSARKGSNNSVAFEFECEPINSSVSSVFTDNEVLTETKKKKARRSKKIRNTPDLRDIFKDTASTDSLDSDTPLKGGKAKKSNLLAEIHLLSLTKKSRRKKIPLFTLPDITFSAKSDDDLVDDAVTKKAKSKRKIRYTQDLNTISIDTRDSDVALKVRSKRTKKTRLPSFLPPVDMIDESKKLDRSKSSTSESDNKENDIDLTDTKESTRKRRRATSRSTNKKPAKNEERVYFDGIEETVGGESTNHGSAPIRKSARKPTEKLSKRNSFITNVNVGISVNAVGDTESPSSKSEDETSEQLSKRDEKLSMSRIKPKKDTFVQINNSQNESVNKNSELADDQSQRLGNQSKLKRNTFNLRNNELSSTLNKTEKTNSFDKSMPLYSEASQAENSSHTETRSVIESPASSYVERTSDKIETAKINESQQSTGLSNRRFFSVSNLESLSTISVPNTSAASMSTRAKSLNMRTSAKASKLKLTSNELDSSRRPSTGNRISSDFTESLPNLEPLDSVSDRYTSVPSLRTSIRSETSKSTSFIKSINSEETFNKLESPSLRDSHGSASNRFSSDLAQSVTNLESLNSISESNARPSDNVHRRSMFRSVPNLELSSNVSKSHERKSTTTFRTDSKRSGFDVNDSDDNSPDSEKDNSFEIYNVNLEQDIDDGACNEGISTRDTYDIVPSRSFRDTRASRSVLSDKQQHAQDDTFVDLTESIIKPSSNEKQKRSTFNKETSDKRKSSFEVSFKANRGKRNPEEVLDHLNITRRDSRKSSFRKSSTDRKYSTGSEREDTKPRRNFVTVRKRGGYHTMIDFDSENSLNNSAGGSGKGGLKKFKNVENLNENRSGDKIVLSDKSSPEVMAGPSGISIKTPKEPAPKKSILKKSIVMATRDIRRDTFEIAECFYDTLERQDSQAKSSVSQMNETPHVTLVSEEQRDIFDLVMMTPTGKLGSMMIGSGESVIMGQSFLNDTDMSTMPKLTRSFTFTKDEEGNSSSQARKSTRKRWSQVERTPIFDKMPPSDEHSTVTTDTALEITANKSKSVTIKTPPNFSPGRRWNSSLKTTPREPKAAEKGKRSVKIQTPVKTPKIRLHSPLAIRKTPRINFGAVDSSILAGNCAYVNSPPSSSSTPYAKKKELSLLQKVLTSEKNKSERTIGKSSVKPKMPNFAKIHQRQYEKMENLKEMQERKAIRAQFLLSGSKPPANTSAPKITERESRKQLKFSPKKLESSVAGNVCGPKAAKANNPKCLSKPLQHMLHKRASLGKKKKEVKSKLPVAVAKPVVKPVIVEKATAKPEPKGLTRFGFKLPTGKENVTKNEQIKAVSAKSKITVNRTETNRKQLGGVRSNRRFELLMKMRENKNKEPSKYKYEPKKPFNLRLAKVPSKNFSTSNRKYEPKKPFNLRLAKVPPENFSTSNRSKSISKPVQRMLNTRALNKRAKKQGTSKIPIPTTTLKITLPKVIEENSSLKARGFTRFGFKLPLGKEKISKTEEIKAVTMKSKITRDRVEEDRRQIKTVRGNRRFELLMKKRENYK